MASIGLNVARDGSASVETLRSLNATWIRIVAMGEHDLTEYLRSLRNAGIRILLVLARESFAAGTLTLYHDRYAALVDCIQVANEPDLVSPSSWSMTQGELVALGKSVRAAFPTTPLVCAGMASGHPEWMDGMDLGWADAVACHPYLKDGPNPNDIEDLPDMDELVRAYRRFGKPVIVSEWGWWGSEEGRAAEEVDDAVKWAAGTRDCAVFFYFCLTDSMVPPFGLLKADGKEKTRAKRFRQRAEFAVEVPWLPAAPEVPVPDLREYARNAARRNGVDPETFVRQIQQESGFNPDAHNAGSGADGIAQIIERWHPTMAGRTRDPLASLDYAAAWMGQLLAQNGGSYPRALASYNWGPGNVASWDGRRSALPAETRHYLDVILGADWDAAMPADGRVRFDANEPARPQDKSYDCSQESVEWAMYALGREPNDALMEQAMKDAGVMSAANGLEDASGAGLAAFITDYWGEFGFYANHEPSVSFDWVAAEGDHAYPVLIGGQAFNHWVGVRGCDAGRDLLLLANSADGHKGVGQTMNREQFESLGPFSAVRVLHPDLLTDAPAEPEVPAPSPSRASVLVGEIRERLDELAALVA